MVSMAVLALSCGCGLFVKSELPVTTDATFIERQAQYYNVTWISPTDIWIDNYYAGATAEYNLTIHNGKDVAIAIKIGSICPTSTIQGYFVAPAKALEWVKISDVTFVLAPKETRDIMISLEMPKGASIEFEKWEYRITAFEQGQGNIEKGMAMRCFVDMKK